MIANEIFIDAARILGQSLDPERSIKQLLLLLTERAGFIKVRVVLPHLNGSLHIAYAAGLDEQEIQRGIYQIGEGITGRVMQNRQIALIPDIRKEPAYLARAAELSQLPTHTAYIAVPIVHKERAVGVLAAHRIVTHGQWLESDSVMLQIFAAWIQLVLRIDELVTEKTEHLFMENRNLKRVLTSADSSAKMNSNPGIIGESVKLKLAIKTTKLAADTDAAVLLRGESGTGKEKFARMIHFNSPRRGQPFIAINCAAIPENLLESELFGHEKGSFTGAAQRSIGKFEAADGGTLFLDEIGDMSVDLQSKFLRALQEGCVQRVGSTSTVPVNVRIIAATHKDLQKAIQEGEFRLDLYYRLNVIPIELPPLRDRDGDIPLLTVYFLNRANQRHRRNVSLDANSFNCLNNYHWPGNIRQLENVIERLVILSEQERITAGILEPMLELESDFCKTQPNTIDNILYHPRPYNRVNPIDREKIIKTLNECRGNKTHTAIKLGLTPRQLQYRIQKLEIADD